MSAVLMDLVATGAQDVYLTGKPEITFFKALHRRHTNFSMESIDQTLLGPTGFGSKFNVTVSRNGDLVYRVWLEVDLPKLESTLPKTAVKNDADFRTVANNLTLDGNERTYDNVEHINTDTTSNNAKFNVVVNGDGSLEEIVVIDGGTGYTSQVLTLTIGGKEIQIPADALTIDTGKITEVDLSKVKGISSNTNYNTNEKTYTATFKETSGDGKGLTIVVNVDETREASIEVTNGGAGYKKDDTITFTLDGTDVILTIVDDMLTEASLKNGSSWGYCKWVGHKLVKKVSVDIGGQQIDEQDSGFRWAWDQLTEDPNNAGYQTMLGAAGGTELKKLYIPIKVWFSENLGLALPLIALQYHEV